MTAAEPLALPARPTVVLDTDVLMSRQRHALWLWARAARYRGHWCSHIITELVIIRTETALRRGATHRVYAPRIKQLVRTLAAVLTLTEGDDARVPAGGDPGDTPVIACALAAGVDAIVTFNVRDFASLGRQLGLAVLTPTQFSPSSTKRRWPRAGSHWRCRMSVCRERPR